MTRSINKIPRLTHSWHEHLALIFIFLSRDNLPRSGCVSLFKAIDYVDIFVWAELSAACFWHFRDTELQWTQCSCHANIQTLNVSVNHIHTTWSQSEDRRSHCWPIRAEDYFLQDTNQPNRGAQNRKGINSGLDSGWGWNLKPFIFTPRAEVCVTSNVPISNHLMCDYNCCKTVCPLDLHHFRISLLTWVISGQGQRAVTQRISSSHINS